MIKDYVYYNVKIIFAYYVGDEFSYLHKWHLYLLNNVLFTPPDIVRKIEFHLLVDDINNVDLIEQTKQNILSYMNVIWHERIEFIIKQNDIYAREGKIYKEEIIDKLDKYDDKDLIIFLHTKGVSNKVNLENLENTIHWICTMYFFNFFEIFGILTYFYNNNIIYYGTLYNYDQRSLVKYKWQYVGSFHWLMPSRLLKYLNSKGYSQDSVSNNFMNNINIRYIAEAFCGNFVEPKYAGFLNYDHFNKRSSHFLYENSDLAYYNILYLLTDYLSNTNYQNYITYFNRHKNIFDQHINETTVNL